MNAPFQRAVLLLHQGRFADALRELQEAERLQPDRAPVAEMQAVVLSRMGRHEAAVEAARRAIELDPESNPAHSVLTRVCLERGDLKGAERAVAEALRLDPEDPLDHGLLARIRFEQGRWTEAVAAADAGLARDPTHDLCLHYRAVALVVSGRKEEARQALESLLSEAPDCAETHAAVGMSLLRAGDTSGARESFQEALRLDPMSEDAREGLVTALRGRYRLYALALRILMRLGQYRTAGVWAVGLVAIVALRGTRWLENRGPEWVVPAALITGLFWTVAVFLVVAEPLFELVLRSSREGRLAMTDAAIRASNWNGLLLLVAAGMGLVWSFLGGFVWSSCAMGSVLMTGAVRETFAARSPWVRWRMGVYTVFLGVCLAGALVGPILGLALGRMGGVLLLRWAPMLPVVSMVGSMFADNVRAWLERRQPDALA